MSANLIALLYLVAGALFILALRGLSHPETSRRGNQLGMAGMAIAVVTTLFAARPDGPLAWFVIILAVAIGGSAGAVIARRIPMTAMPQLIAGFHSLVGLAAVLVAAAALYSPAAFGIGEVGHIHTGSLIEMSIGAAIGAITFTGSIVAFTKLQGLVSGAPVSFQAQHLVNLAIGIAIVVLIILFILALRGLSHPVTSRRGNQLGMAGMAIAVLTTLFGSPPDGIFGWLLLILALGLGGAVGAVVARRIPMTAMPQLVAAFHSLVGMAAVLVAAAALYAPQAFGIGVQGDIHGASLVEMTLGAAIGAVTFTGSVIAFLKLDGRMSGKPILLPARHIVNAGLAVMLVLLIVLFVRTESHLVFWLIALTSFVLGGLIIVPIGGADMPVVISMLNS